MLGLAVAKIVIRELVNADGGMAPSEELERPLGVEAHY